MTKFNNTKKWVYAAAMTGVLFAGAQYANSSSNYLVKADTSNNASQHQYKYNTKINFKDQNNNSLGGITASSDSNNFQKSRLSYTLNYHDKNYDFTNQIKNDKDIPDTIDLSQPEYNYTLAQPTHTLTVKIVDKDTGATLGSRDYTVTDFGSTSIKDIVDQYANDYNYNYSDPFNYETEYTVEVSKDAVSSASSSTIHGQTSASYDNEGKQTASTATSSAAASTSTDTNESSSASEQSSSAESSSAASSSQSSESSSAQSSEASSSASQSSEASSSETNASQASKQNSESANASSVESSVESSVAESMAKAEEAKEAANKEEANKEAENKTVDNPVNNTEVKHATNKADSVKNDANKLPQTGDKTNQQAIAGVGIIAMIAGAVLGLFGLRRKNK